MDRPIIVFDLETTAVELSTAKIVQLAAVKVSPTLEQLEEPKNILINPGVPIPAEATEIHGITDDMVKEQGTFSEYAKSIFDYFDGCDVAGFNSNKFDVPLLSEEFNRVNRGLDWPPHGIKMIDACHIYHKNEKRDLTAAYRFYCNKELDGAHDASKDIIASLEVLIAQIAKYDDLRELDVQGLHHYCGGDIRVDLAGTIVLNEQGVACYAIGKAKGKPVVQDPGFGNWMLKSDFTKNTKDILTKLLFTNKLF